MIEREKEETKWICRRFYMGETPALTERIERDKVEHSRWMASQILLSNLAQIANLRDLISPLLILFPIRQYLIMIEHFFALKS